jgi:pilus assembly protein CpaE
MRITIVESSDQRVTDLVKHGGLTVASTLSLAELPAVDRQGPPDVLVVDLRGETSVPSALAPLNRKYAGMGVVIVASSADPALLLEAMRAGANEFLVEPLAAQSLREAIDRVAGRHAVAVATGRVVAFVGAKGGVGTTTIAVNVAAALAERPKTKVLIVDLHIAAHGDVALMLGVEPRFSVVDAIENAHRLDDAFLRGLVSHAKSGVDVLASPERPMIGPPTGESVRALIEALATHYPLVVVDVPRTDLGVIDAIEPLSAFGLVVNQELPTVRRAAQIAAILRQRYGKERVQAVVSRYDTRADIGREDIERVVGLPVSAVLPSDYRKVIASANVGQPLIADNHTRLASAIRELAVATAGPAPAQPAAKMPRSSGRFLLRS